MLGNIESDAAVRRFRVQALAIPAIARERDIQPAIHRTAVNIAGQVAEAYSAIGRVKLQVAVKMLETDAAVHRLQFRRELPRSMDHVVHRVALVSPVKIWALVVNRAARRLNLNLAQYVGCLRGAAGPSLDARVNVNVLPVFTQDMNPAIHAGYVQLSRPGNRDRAHFAGVLLVVAPAPVGMVLVFAGAVANRPPIGGCQRSAVPLIDVRGMGPEAVQKTAPSAATTRAPRLGADADNDEQDSREDCESAHG